MVSERSFPLDSGNQNLSHSSSKTGFTSYQISLLQQMLVRVERMEAVLHGKETRPDLQTQQTLPTMKPMGEPKPMEDLDISLSKYVEHLVGETSHESQISQTPEASQNIRCKEIPIKISYHKARKKNPAIITKVKKHYNTQFEVKETHTVQEEPNELSRSLGTNIKHLRSYHKVRFKARKRKSRKKVQTNTLIKSPYGVEDDTEGRQHMDLFLAESVWKRGALQAELTHSVWPWKYQSLDTSLAYTSKLNGTRIQKTTEASSSPEKEIRDWTVQKGSLEAHGSTTLITPRGKEQVVITLDVVTEFIEGLVKTYHVPQYLDGFPDFKVVLRADGSAAKYDKVAVISGGGSGHEPTHAGYVGDGMLTAAICRDFFASTPVDSILAGIRAVTGTQGCLLIVKNYRGDRLNLGLAAEQAKSEGYKVETVMVGEDCALPPPHGIAGRRGLAGTILVHKVVGVAAVAGLSLEKVAAEAKYASEMVGTLGVALSVCTLPGHVTSDRLDLEKMELGLGIHVELGADVVDVQHVDVVVLHVLQQILSHETNYVPITCGNRVVLMVNGLGATLLMELMIAAGKAIPKLQLEHELAGSQKHNKKLLQTIFDGLSFVQTKLDTIELCKTRFYRLKMESANAENSELESL